MVTETSLELAGNKGETKMAIPKTLREIDKQSAERTIARHLKAGTGNWENSPMYSDFVYKCGKGYKLLRPPLWPCGRWETGVVSM